MISFVFVGSEDSAIRSLWFGELINIFESIINKEQVGIKIPCHVLRGPLSSLSLYVSIYIYKTHLNVWQLSTEYSQLDKLRVWLVLACCWNLGFPIYHLMRKKYVPTRKLTSTLFLLLLLFLWIFSMRSLCTRPHYVMSLKSHIGWTIQSCNILIGGPFLWELNMHG